MGQTPSLEGEKSAISQFAQNNSIMNQPRHNKTDTVNERSVLILCFDWRNRRASPRRVDCEVCGLIKDVNSSVDVCMIVSSGSVAV